MKIYSITVDAMPKSCGSCPLCGYTNDDFPVCYGVADKQIWRIEGNPCDMQYRRSDCPLIAVRMDRDLALFGAVGGLG